MARLVKNPPAVQEIWVPSLGREYPLEEATATHSRIPGWRIPWTEEAGGLQSRGSHRVGYDRVNKSITMGQGAVKSPRQVWDVLSLQLCQQPQMWHQHSCFQTPVLLLKHCVSFIKSLKLSELLFHQLQHGESNIYRTAERFKYKYHAWVSSWILKFSRNNSCYYQRRETFSLCLLLLQWPSLGS